ncbi:MAG: histidine triad nucleotide-binding protein [Mariprofundales bacterium]
MSCLFCKIIQGKIPCKKVYEDEYVYAFHDINPKAPIHVLVIPKKHIDNLDDCDDIMTLGHWMSGVRHVAQILGVGKTGYRVNVHVRAGGGQEVMHIHAHIMAKKL